MGSMKPTPLLVEPQTVLHKDCLAWTEQNSNIIKINNNTLLSTAFINLLN